MDLTSPKAADHDVNFMIGDEDWAPTQVIQTVERLVRVA
jgi:hypothetical protein